MNVFGDPHLGDLVAALVDGELAHDARDRALSHMAHCERCRREVEAHRRIKRRLRELPDAPPDATLEDRLRALAAEPRPGAAARPRQARRGAGHPPAGSPPRRPRAPRRRTRVPAARTHRRRWVLAGATSLVALGVAAVLAGGDTGGPAVNPPVDRFVVEHVATTGELPLSDPAAGAATVSFASVGGP